MPHASIRGALPLSEIWNKFEPAGDVDGSAVLQLESAFLRKDHGQLLILALAIENGVSQRFFIVIGNKGDQTIVRCQQHHAPQKTRGVKTLLNRVVKLLTDEGAEVEQSNLD